MALLKDVIELIEAHSAAANLGLAFEKANIHASLREQGSNGQTADATAHDNNFAVHLSANKVKQGKQNKGWVHRFRCGKRSVRVGFDDQQCCLNSVEY